MQKHVWFYCGWNNWKKLRVKLLLRSFGEQKMNFYSDPLLVILRWWFAFFGAFCRSFRSFLFCPRKFTVRSRGRLVASRIQDDWNMFHRFLSRYWKFNGQLHWEKFNQGNEINFVSKRNSIVSHKFLDAVPKCWLPAPNSSAKNIKAGNRDKQTEKKQEQWIKSLLHNIFAVCTA